MIISKDKKIFLGKKHAHGGGVYVDFWHLPGGGVDEDENFETALRREISEETGINIKNYSIELIDDKGIGESEKTLRTTGEKVLCTMSFNVFKVSASEDASEILVKIGDDLEIFQWADISELDKIKLTPPSIELFERLGLIK
jgi:8-oxo-dGTP pyrophosphatase MutT (NUDIX family)